MKKNPTHYPLNTNHYLLFVVVVAIIAVVMPLLVSAHVSFPYLGGEPIVSCGRGGGTPVCDRDELIHTIIHIIYFGMSIALYIILPITFGWGGIMFLTSGGNEGRIGTAKKIMTGAVVGAVLVLSAFLIVRIFVGVLGIQGVANFSGAGSSSSDGGGNVCVPDPLRPGYCL